MAQWTDAIGPAAVLVERRHGFLISRRGRMTHGIVVHPRMASFFAEITNIPAALGLTAVFALAGIVLLAVGYAAFDLLTPGKLSKAIFEEKNQAAATVTAAYLIAVAIIIAASIAG